MKKKPTVHHHAGPGDYRHGATLCGILVEFTGIEGNTGKPVSCKRCMRSRLKQLEREYEMPADYQGEL